MLSLNTSQISSSKVVTFGESAMLLSSFVPDVYSGIPEIIKFFLRRSLSSISSKIKGDIHVVGIEPRVGYSAVHFAFPVRLLSSLKGTVCSRFQQFQRNYDFIFSVFNEDFYISQGYRITGI